MQLPMPSLGLAEIIEELIDQDPRAVRARCGVPHPLSNFAGPNFVDGLFADIILDFIHDTVWEGAESMRYKAACWFLLESEMAFFFACSEAGIDANRFAKSFAEAFAERLAVTHRFHMAGEGWEGI